MQGMLTPCIIPNRGPRTTDSMVYNGNATCVLVGNSDSSSYGAHPLTLHEAGDTCVGQCVTA
jgi:hypothetical protein